MNKWIHWGLLLVLILIAAVFRFYDLASNDYWYDEMLSLYYAISEDWRSIFWDNSPFVYNALLKIWVQWWGDSESMTRLLSVYFSLGTLSLFWFLGEPAESTDAASIWKRLRLVLLGTVSFMSLKYAREARPYAMFEFFATLNLLLFLPHLNSDRKSNNKYLFLSGLPLLFSHYFSVFQLFTEAAFKLRREKHKKFFLATLALLLSIVFIFVLNVRWDSLIWLQSRYELEDLSWLPYKVFVSVSFSSYLLAAIILALFVWDIRNWKKISARHQFLIINILFPIFIMTIFSLVFRMSAMIPRFFIFLVPSIIVYLNDKLNSLNDRKTALAATVVVLITAVYSLPEIYQKKNPPWSAAVDLIAASQQPAVFTSQSSGIGSPYFQRHKILVRKWPANPQGVQMIEQSIQAGQTTWMLDTYWAASAYFPSLEALMKERNYIPEVQSLASGSAEPIMLMKIKAKTGNE